MSFGSLGHDGLLAAGRDEAGACSWGKRQRPFSVMPLTLVEFWWVEVAYCWSHSRLWHIMLCTLTLCTEIPVLLHMSNSDEGIKSEEWIAGSWCSFWCLWPWAGNCTNFTTVMMQLQQSWWRTLGTGQVISLTLNWNRSAQKGSSHREENSLQT